MRSNEIFAGMSGEEALAFLEEMRTDAPEVATLALGAAAEAFRLRPDFLRKQPRPRQAEWMRRALGRTVGARLAEEVLATYFLDHRQEMLIELLDALGVEHDEGRLAHEEPDCPEPKALEKAVKGFRSGDEPDKRDLLLRAFAAQDSIEWAPLDSLLTGSAPEAKAASPKAAAAKAPSSKAAASTKKAARKAKAKPKAKPRAKTKAKAARKKAATRGRKR